MFLPKLYKKSATGAIQEWSIEVCGNKFRTLAGQVGGVITVSKYTECHGKNIGKSNETSDKEQAMLEAKAKWTKKQERGGYTTDIKKVNQDVYIKPMLALKFEDYADRLDFQKGVWVSTKLNGVRCVVSKDGMFSRTGKVINSCPHIIQSLQDFFKVHPDKILDGELFNYDLRQNLGELISTVAKKAPDPKAKDIVEYWVYDIVDSTQTFSERYNFISKIFPFKQYIKICKAKKVNSIDAIDIALTAAEADGQEGVMVRSNGVYENKRSKYLLKYKTFIDEEFKIVGIEEGKGNLAGMVGNFSFIAKNGQPFEGTPTGSHESWAEMWSNKAKLIGKFATVKYKELTPVTSDGGGVPSFAKVICIRDYE